MTSRGQQWARGYAKQARSDFEVFAKLRDIAGVPDCRRLHFLQMACEKLYKAHLCRRGTNPDALQASHAFIAGPLPVIIDLQFARLGGKAGRDHVPMLKLIGQIAREIELLAPTVTDGGRRPENCEYPWEDAGGLHVPVDHSFPNLSLLKQRAGMLFLKLIPLAIDELLET